MSQKPNVRVNPFVFPSELTFYFILMVILSSMPTISVAFSMVNLSAINHFESVLRLLAPIILFFLTFCFYFTSIKGKIRKYNRYKLQEKCPEIYDLITSLCRKYEIKMPEAFWYDSERFDATVFGFKNHYYLVISSAICEKFKVFPDMVQTIILHELSHLKNKDVVQHELAESLWKSFGILALINIAYGSIIYYEWIRSWLIFSALVYLLPSLVIFYLNNAIQRWREIYADIRTIIIQGTDRNLITLLRFLHPIIGATLPKRILSPFTLSFKRVKMISEDPNKHIVERGAICVILSLISRLAILYSMIFLWPFIESLEILEMITIVWLLETYLLFSITLLPYWTFIFKSSTDVFHFILKIFTAPLKISVILTTPLLMFFTIFFSYPFEISVYLFTITYLFLLIHEFTFQLALSCIQLSSRTKILLAEAVLLIFPIMLTLYYLNLANYYYAILICVFFVCVFLLLLSIKYSKCPYCGKDIKILGLFRCKNCMSKFNKDFLIFLSSDT
jgi:Zn-dependent protease with chaperone function